MTDLDFVRCEPDGKDTLPPCWALPGPVTGEVTTLAVARGQALSSIHASIGGAQYWHPYTYPSFYERLRGSLGNDLLTCQQGHDRTRDDEHGTALDEWRRITAEPRDKDLWLRVDTDEESEDPVPPLVPFVDRLPQ